MASWTLVAKKRTIAALEFILSFLKLENTSENFQLHKRAIQVVNFSNVVST